MSKQFKDHVTELFYGEGAVKLHMPLIVSGGRTAGVSPINQNMIAGIALTPEEESLNHVKEDYELWIGDVIIIPQIKLAGYDEHGAMINHVLTRPGWANKEKWSREIWRIKEGGAE